jgi:TetR/AcrR family transcriptional repressor of mexJK operon
MSATLKPRHETDSPKRLQILDAAANLFIAQGYGAVSMDAIARAAGVSKATLYAHFTSKDLLFATIIGEACRENLMGQWLTSLEDGALVTDVRAALTALGLGLLRLLLEERSLAIYRVVVAESVRFPELGRAFHENGPVQFRRAFGPWLDEQAKAGRLRAADPDVAADQFIGLLRSGLYLRAALGLPPAPTEAEIAATVTAAVDTFMRAFG